MNWQTLIKKLADHGYKGEANDLAAAKAYIAEHFDVIEVNGEAVDVDALHKKAFPPKPKLDMTEAANAADISEQVASQVADVLKQVGFTRNSEGHDTKAHKHDVSVGKDRLADDPKGGFKHSGEYFKSVVESGNPGETGFTRNEKLLAWTKAAASTISVEQTGADGGFAVPPEFRDQIMERVSAEGSILSRCDQTPISRSSLTVPVDETTPWQTSGGVLGAWEGETGTLSQSKVNLKERTWRANKYTVLCPVSQELLEDATAMQTYIPRKAGAKIDFAVGEAIFRGTGSGQPVGFLNSSALISVAKESGQDADTIVARNIQKMYQRMYGEYRANAVWFYNQDCETQLQRMFVQGVTDAGTNVAAGGLVYLPAGGLSGSPYATLMGRPMIPTQHCETVGDLGDIVLVDLRQYHCVVKGGVKSDQSIHLWFDQDLTAFRFILRVGGAPWNETTISPRDGSNTMSAFIALAARA